MAYSLRQLEISRRVDGMLWFVAACICVCNVAVSLANGQQGRPRYPLSASQIVGEMQNRQLPTHGVQVRLPAPITAAVVNPRLEIQTVALLNSHEMRLRVICRDHSECLPFFATATFSDELNSAATSAKPDDHSLSNVLPVSAAGPAVEAPKASTPSKRASLVGPPILRSGSLATLDFDQERVHVHIEVICLESGAVGDKIRVTTRDRKLTYVAEVVTPTLLKGIF